MRKQSKGWLATCLFASVFLLPMPSPATDDETDWFEEEFQALTQEVNEGELRFLAEPPEKPVHHHHNRMTLNENSLQDGWVTLLQCHTNIDNVGRAQILYRAGRIRDLTITETQNIGKVWIEGASVQLEDVEKDSRLCISAQSLVVTAGDDGSYRIKNGPFMRRFLDGYYPMRVTLEIDYATSGLRFASVKPEIQPGFEVEDGAQSVRFEAWFEGRLRTEIELKPADIALSLE